MAYYENERKFDVLIGKTLINIERRRDEDDGEELLFTTSEGEKYSMYHDQDCCESVTIEDITGDLNDLLNTPILDAAEVSNSEGEALDPEYDESYTWTYYTLRTIKGSVTIRWYGTSNGYYSESVDFVQVS